MAKKTTTSARSQVSKITPSQIRHGRIQLQFKRVKLKTSYEQMENINNDYFQKESENLDFDLELERRDIPKDRVIYPHRRHQPNHNALVLFTNENHKEIDILVDFILDTRLSRKFLEDIDEFREKLYHFLKPCIWGCKSEELHIDYISLKPEFNLADFLKESGIQAIIPFFSIIIYTFIKLPTTDLWIQFVSICLLVLIMLKIKNNPKINNFKNSKVD